MFSLLYETLVAVLLFSFHLLIGEAGDAAQQLWLRCLVPADWLLVKFLFMGTKAPFSYLHYFEHSRVESFS